jgi:O-antigen/teichoic acid export membrane protein
MAVVTEGRRRRLDPASERGVAANAAVQIAGRVGAAVLGLATVHLLTGSLGPAAFGRFTAAWTLALLVSALAGSGLATTASRDAAHDPASAGGILAAALSLRFVALVASVPATVVVSAVLYGTSGRALATVALLSVAASATGVAAVGAMGFVTLGQGWLSGVLDVVRQGLLLLAVAVLVAHGHGSVTTAYALGLGAGTLLTLVLAARSTPWRDPRPHLRPLLVGAAPLALVEVLNAIYFRVDSVLLAVVSGDIAVGRYGVAYRVVELALTVPGIVMTTLVPRLVRSPDPSSVVGEGLVLLTRLGIPFVVGGCLLADDLVRLLAGDAFAGAVVPLRLLLVAAGVSFLVAPYSNGLVLLHRQRDLVRVYVVATLVNLAVNAALIPLWDERGAAVSVVLTELVILAMVVRRFDRVRRLRPVLTTPVVVGVAVMLGAWWAVDAAVADSAGPGLRLLATLPAMLLAVGAPALLISRRRAR